MAPSKSVDEFGDKSAIKSAAGPVIRIAVDQIDIAADRLRTLKPDQAYAIGFAIQADGQYDPISVARLPGKTTYLLVDGLHRLQGCRAVGIAEIEARVVDADRNSRIRHEVLSAWARADHDAFDAAAQVAAMAELAQSAGIEIVGDNTASATIALAVGWDVAAYEALGISRRSLFNYLKIHRFYTDAQKATLRERGLANELVPLIRLAALPPEDFKLAFAAIERGCTIPEALAFAAPAPIAAWDKQKAKVVKQAGGWEPHQLRELIDELRALYRAVTNGVDAG